MLAKLTDAASMFWQSLDERERLALVALGCYLVVALGAAIMEDVRASLTRGVLEELELERGIAYDGDRRR